MKAFWKGKKENKQKHLMNRFKVNFKSKTGSVHYVIIISGNSDDARMKFLNYYGVHGDEIIDIEFHPDENLI
jgi:hypothetical protein